jgi:hypothetical protein
MTHVSQNTLIRTQSPLPVGALGHSPGARKDRLRVSETAQPSHSISRPDQPRSLQWGELKDQAIMAFESGLLPKAINSRQKAITIALMGSELGLSPMQALCGIYVVNGMTALRGSLMLRLIYERISGARISITTPPEKADMECTVEMQRPQGKALSFRFTLEDAKKAGFLNKPIWQQHTATMLRWAAIRTGARVVFADAIAGCYMEDEIPGSADVTAETVEVESPEVLDSAPTETGRLATKVYPEPTAWSAPRLVVRDVPRERHITEKQIKRLYAIANEKNWGRQRITTWMADWFQKRDPSDLTRTEYDQLCDFILSQQ